MAGPRATTGDAQAVCKPSAVAAWRSCGTAGLSREHRRRAWRIVVLVSAHAATGITCFHRRGRHGRLPVDALAQPS
jgi:hypothetical protein